MQNQSVWSGLDERAFYENTIILELLDRSQGISPTKFADLDDESDSHHHQDQGRRWIGGFLDDFALIAAGSGGAANVTAACLERGELPTKSFTVRVAKNEAFTPPEIQYLDGIVTIMNRVRNRDIHIQYARDECLIAVLRHCDARLKRYITSLRDLLSSLSIGDQSPKLKTCPWYRLSDNHCESKEDVKRLGAYCANTHAEYMQISHQRLINIVDLVRQICSSDYQQSVNSLASLSYQVRQSSSFRLLLESASQGRHNQVAKVMEKIGKISKFYRSAVTIVQVAASFCNDVTYLKVETLTSQKRAIGVLSSSDPADLMNRVPPASRSRLHHQAGAARRLLRRKSHYVVHAEMQLLLFYDTQPDSHLALNYIGISKRSCYLCATFIRFHRVFIMEGVHQQLYCLWTIPPRISFRDKTRKINFVKALSSLCENVQAKVKAIPAGSCSQYPFHGESVANFSRASLLSNADLTAKLTSEVSVAFETVQSTFVRCLTSPFKLVYSPPQHHPGEDNNATSTLGPGLLPPEEEPAEEQQNRAPLSENNLSVVVELTSIHIGQGDNCAFEERVTPERENPSGLPRSAEHSLHIPASTREDRSIRCDELPSDTKPCNDLKERIQGSKDDTIQSIGMRNLRDGEAAMDKDGAVRRRRRKRKTMKVSSDQDPDPRRSSQIGPSNIWKHGKPHRKRYTKTERRRRSRGLPRKREDNGRASPTAHRKVHRELRRSQRRSASMLYEGGRRRRRRPRLTAEIEGEEIGCLHVVLGFQKFVGAILRGLTRCLLLSRSVLGSAM